MLASGLAEIGLLKSVLGSQLNCFASRCKAALVWEGNEFHSCRQLVQIPRFERLR
jgi:hypothetical protein